MKGLVARKTVGAPILLHAFFKGSEAMKQLSVFQQHFVPCL